MSGSFTARCSTCWRMPSSTAPSEALSMSPAGRRTASSGWRSPTRGPESRQSSAGRSLSPSSGWTTPAPASRAARGLDWRWYGPLQRPTAAPSAWRRPRLGVAASCWSCLWGRSARPRLRRDCFALGKGSLACPSGTCLLCCPAWAPHWAIRKDKEKSRISWESRDPGSEGTVKTDIGD